LIIVGLFITYWKKMYLTHTLIFINTIVFIITVASSDNWSIAYWDLSYNSPVYYDLTFRTQHLYTGQAALTIFTSMYLHSNFIHYLFNMLFMMFVGLLLEEKIGTLRFGIIYFIAGIVSAFTWAVTTGLFSSNPILGASGGLYGIMGAYAILYPEEKFAIIPIPYPLPIRTWASIFALLAIVGTLPLETSCCFFTRIAHMAHIGGLLAGIALGPYVMRIKTETKKKITKIDVEALEQLAITDDQKEMLEKIKSEDEPEVRDAWLEYFLEKTLCPQCGKKPVRKGRALTCECGFELKY